MSAFYWNIENYVRFNRRNHILNAFASIKTYLRYPQVLGSQLKTTYPFHYCSRDIYCLTLAQENKEGTKRALYYLIHTLVGAKMCYSPIERMHVG